MAFIRGIYVRAAMVMALGVASLASPEPTLAEPLVGGSLCPGHCCVCATGPFDCSNDGQWACNMQCSGWQMSWCGQGVGCAGTIVACDS